MTKKNLLIFFPIFLFLVVFLGILSYSFFIDSKIQKNISIDIQKGDSRFVVINSISEQLELNSFQINSLKLFYFLNREKIEVGNYTYPKDTKIYSILTGFKNLNTQLKVTFLEGTTVEENALILKEILGSDFAKQYYTLALPKIGYLYPDTYFVDSKTTPQGLIDTQLKNFDLKTSQLLSSNSSNLSKEEIIKFASVVEREERGTENRKIVAGILIKRYERNMSIDADATTQYGIALKNYSPFVLKCITNKCPNFSFWSAKITKDDLEKDDGFNTRKVLGLPKTPICNPSADSVLAVVQSKASPYYFYLHDLKGNTYFARDNDEHVANKQKYL